MILVEIQIVLVCNYLFFPSKSYPQSGKHIISQGKNISKAILMNLLRVIIAMSHPVKLSDIEDVSLQHLSSNKLEALNSGKSPDGPIKLRRSTGTPYYILDGRHRIYLARQAGKSLIEANFDDD